MIDFHQTEQEVILQIPYNHTRADMIHEINEAFGNGADMVRVGVRLFDNEIVIVSSEWEHSSSSGDNGVGLLTLAELLDNFPEKFFNLSIVEDKPQMADRYAGILTGRNAVGRVLTSSLYGKVLHEFKRQLSDAVTAYSFIRVVGLYALYRSGLIYFKRKFSAKVVQTYEMVGPSYIASQGFIRMLKSRGIRVHVFVENNDIAVHRLLEQGVTGLIIKDIGYIHRLKEIFKLPI